MHSGTSNASSTFGSSHANLIHRAAILTLEAAPRHPLAVMPPEHSRAHGTVRVLIAPLGRFDEGDVGWVRH